MVPFNKIYIITLNHKEEYKQELLDRLNRLGVPSNIPVEFIYAANGTYIMQTRPYVVYDGSRHWLNCIPYEKWDAREYPTNYDFGPESFWLRPITRGEIGCAMSHMMTWLAAYNEGVENALILEDDFYPEWENVDWRVFDELPAFDILYLGRHSLSGCDEVGLEYFLKPYFGYQAHAYVLSRSGLDKLINGGAYDTFRENIIPTDEFLPTLHSTHPRNDIAELFPNQNFTAFRLRSDLISQTRYEANGLSQTSWK